MNLDQQLIGGLLIFPKAYWSLDLDPVAVSGNYRDIYEGIGDLMRSGDDVDVVSVSEKTKVSMVELNDYTKLAITSFSARNAAKAIKGRYRRGKMTQSLQQALARLSEGEEPVDLLSDLSATLRDGERSDTVSIYEGIEQAIARAEDYKNSAALVKVGIPSLDRIMALRGGKMFVIAGRPGGFKSALALKILKTNAMSDIPSGLISLEMDAAENADRWLKMAGVNADIANGQGIAEVTAAKTRFLDTPMYINATSFDFHKIESQIVEMVERRKVKVVIIDYLQLIKTSGSKAGWERIGAMTGDLKRLSMRLDIPIGILSQLNRQCEIEKREPMLSDLRESGNIEQDADIVMFMHKELIMKHGEEVPEFWLLLAKQRGGKTGKIPLHINPSKYQISEGTHAEPE